MKFCGECGTKLVDGACAGCTAKSINGLDVESLEKSLATLENISKGVRPAEAKKGDEGDVDKPSAHQEKIVKQVKKYGAKGEGDSEEEPKTKRGIESAAKGGFPGPMGEGGAPGEGEEDPEEEMEERKRREREMAMEGEPEFKSAKGKKAKKSFAEELMQSDEVSKAVDVSDFLEELVYKSSESIDELRGDIEKSLQFHNYQQRFNVGLAKAFNEMGSLVKGLVQVIETIGKQPAGQRKSDVGVIEKGLAGGPADSDKTILTKSQKAEKLIALREGGDKTITDMDIISADSSGFVRDDLKAKLGIN
jgi:hypothetical protein